MRVREALLAVAFILVVLGGSREVVGQASENTDFPDVVKEAKRLRDQGEQKAADLKTLAGQVQSRYMTGTGVLSSGTPEQWRWLSEHCRGALSKTEKAAWRTAIRESFGTTEKIGSLAGDQLAEVGRSLHSLGDPDSLKFMVTAGKARQAEVWRHMGSLGIQAIASRLGNDANDLIIKKNLAEFLIEVSLANEEGARKLSYSHGVRHWEILTRHLAGAVDANAQQLWTKRLRSMYVDANSFDERRLQDVVSLVRAMETLGQADTLDVTAQWLGSQEDLTDKEKGRLLKLVYHYRDKAGEGGGNVASVNVADLAAKLRKHGEKLAAARLSAAWINGQGNLSTLKPAAVPSLIAGLPNLGAEGLRAERKMPDALTIQVLNDPEKIRAIGAERWGGIVKYIKGRRTKEQRSALASRIWDAFCRGNRLPLQLDRNDMRHLVWTIRQLDPSKGSQYAAKWFQNYDILNREDPESQALYARDAVVYAYVAAGGKVNGFDLKEKLSELEPLWENAFRSAKLSYGRCKQLAWLYYWQTDRKKSRLWLDRARDMQVAKSKTTEGLRTKGVVNLARQLGAPEYGLTFRGEGFPGFVDLLVRHVKEGNDLPASALTALAKPCATDSCRESLREALFDEEGRLLVDLAKVLGRAYRQDDRLSDWARYVDAQIEQAAGADARARWLLVKADIQMLRPRKVDARRGKQEIRKAMSVATSQGVRLAAVRELVRRYTAGGRKPAFQAARQAVKSIKGQFDQEGQVVLENILNEMESTRSALARKRSRRALQNAYAHKAARLHYCKKELARALARQDSETAASLQTRIERLSTEMGQ
jgi:hypothetical protein